MFGSTRSKTRAKALVAPTASKGKEKATKHDEDTSLTLNCVVDGKGPAFVFQVTVAGNKKIHSLKKLIHQEGVGSTVCPIATDLLLLKVTTSQKT